jgi:hypothetical protein
MIDLVHPDDFAKTMDTGPRSVAYGQNPMVEFRLRHADGSGGVVAAGSGRMTGHPQNFHARSRLGGDRR